VTIQNQLLHFKTYILHWALQQHAPTSLLPSTTVIYHKLENGDSMEDVYAELTKALREKDYTEPPETRTPPYPLEHDPRHMPTIPTTLTNVFTFLRRLFSPSLLLNKFTGGSTSSQDCKARQTRGRADRN